MGQGEKDDPATWDGLAGNMWRQEPKKRLKISLSENPGKYSCAQGIS